MADVRSPTTWGWVEAVTSAGVVVFGPDGQLWPERHTFRPVGQGSPVALKQRLRLIASATPRRLKVTQGCLRAVGPSLAAIRGRRLRRVVNRVKPDVIHGLRIPYEGIATLAACPRGVPLAVSIWGNDLIYHASINRIMGRATRRLLARTDLLVADCQRDIELARIWGLRPTASTAVLPGGGGIDLARLGRVDSTLATRLNELTRSGYRLVVNPRGSREAVRNDVVLKALSFLAADLDPLVRVVFVDAAHDKILRGLIERHPLVDKILVIGKLAPDEMLSIFCRTEVSLSITDHDGTPNSLLEAMAAGAIPVCGYLASIREWITPGKNGFLPAFDNPREVADALRNALGLSDAERAAVRAENRRIIASRAERGYTGRRAARQYRELVHASRVMRACQERGGELP